VSDATWSNVKDRFEGERRGPIDLRGHGPMETYTIVKRRDPEGETVGTPRVASAAKTVLSPIKT
jgi:hypothetical protein